MRQALLDAAEALFSSDEIDRISIDEIVSTAKVAKGTFYNYFKDKSELYHALIHDVRMEIRSEIMREIIGVPDPARRLLRAFFVATRYRVLNPRRAPMVAASHSPAVLPRDDTNANIIGVVREGMTAGRFRIKDADAGVLALFGIAGITFRTRFHEQEPGRAVSVVQELGAIMLRGLGIPEDEAQEMAAQEAGNILQSLLDRAPDDITS